MQISSISIRLLIALAGVVLALLFGGIGLFAYILINITAYQFFEVHLFSNDPSYDPFNTLGAQICIIVLTLLFFFILCRNLDISFIHASFEKFRDFALIQTAITDLDLGNNLAFSEKAIRDCTAFLLVSVSYPIVMFFIKKPDASYWMADLSGFKHAWMFLTLFTVFSVAYIWAFWVESDLTSVFEHMRPMRIRFLSWYVAPWVLLPMAEILLSCFYRKLGDK